LADARDVLACRVHVLLEHAKRLGMVGYVDRRARPPSPPRRSASSPRMASNASAAPAPP